MIDLRIRPMLHLRNSGIKTVSKCCYYRDIIYVHSLPLIIICFITLGFWLFLYTKHAEWFSRAGFSIGQTGLVIQYDI